MARQYHLVGHTDQVGEPPDAPDPAQPLPPAPPLPDVPPYAAPPGWQPPPPPYAAPPGWQPPPPPPPPYGAPPNWQSGYSPYGYPAPGNTNGFAIAALVCAIVFSVVPFLGVALGIGFGITGLRQCAARNERGRGLAIAGIVIGGLGALFWILALIGLAVDSSGSSGGGLGALAARTVLGG